MRKASQCRLYPTRKQGEALDRERRAACRLDHAALEQRQVAWKQQGPSLTYDDQANGLTDQRARNDPTPTNFSTCQDVLRRLDHAFQAFFARLKRDDTPSYPRLQSWTRDDSLTFPSHGDGGRMRPPGKLYRQGVGEVNLKRPRQLNGAIQTVTVRHRAGQWAACFSVEDEAAPLPVADADGGLELGVAHVAALRTGELVNTRRWSRTAPRHRRRTPRQVVRRVKGSHRRRQAV